MPLSDHFPPQEPEQSQLQAPFTPVILLMNAAAHPTPALTDKAPVGQFIAHAPHSMQESCSTTEHLPSDTTKTAWGQTVSHMRQPLHFEGSSLSEVTPRMYLSVFTTLRTGPEGIRPRAGYPPLQPLSAGEGPASSPCAHPRGRCKWMHR